MFSNGTEHIAFLEYECDDCPHYKPESIIGEEEGCEVEEAIALTAITGEESDFPYKWLDEAEKDGIPYIHRYDCRKKRDLPPKEDE